MVCPARRAKVLRELVPITTRCMCPSADKRAAYALEHIAFRVTRIEQTPSRVAAIEGLVPEA